MTTLLIAEHDNFELKTSTLHALTAARQLGEPVHVLVAGFNVSALAAKAAKFEGIEKVLLADAEHLKDGLAENIEPTVVSIGDRYSHIVFPATAYGKNIAPRVAAKLAVGQISDITRVVTADTFERPIYAGNAIATVQSLDPIKVLTVRLSVFEASNANGGASVPVEAVIAAPDSDSSTVISRTLTKLERPELSAAKVIVSGGRGLGSSERYKSVLEPLADTLGAAMGASRAAVDAGYVPNDFQVGQTGKVVAPDVYIAVGISGAIQHLAGMKDSKTIIAINKDAEAPIFGVADFGLVADLFQVVPELVSRLNA
ncbi:electron transfer flavoprotein subunit alpha/FixB family protein [Paraburkholderia sp. SEWSISQ10-3 4]|uniref:electron transfer flavoprotein subunit alpha/FixB family protein n=1 Tax=Paraburkholderia TaxID=1822464 RepID=UPI00190AF871|nr:MULTISPECIES: electron transfer flavoprotein subunit alpha/FixB family protein [Paraburkholderia]MBK3843143.1 electron transfer flavoprotein subunit alpha/FixB family protein [Paraburkholderia aspalathi]MCX4140287.1 electron transfer flavoprotein subunit alpha/FixB family protein [Paraburkholderia aspalathi]MDN7172974.1 electron transfer flavoprotein subunit alpha/FixB family protein [Paraburkholderia sp. SEWSISQ10-3 4]MDQ6502613.1 electron transfer flavoprotein subunit alpha/FixB family pro